MDSTMAYRYTIDCSVCGFVVSDKTKLGAFAIANRMKERHSMPGERITIFDRLAHYGAPQTFDTDGNCLDRKAQ